MFTVVLWRASCAATGITSCTHKKGQGSA